MSTVFEIFLNFCRTKSESPNKVAILTYIAYLFFFLLELIMPAIIPPATKTAPVTIATYKLLSLAALLPLSPTIIFLLSRLIFIAGRIPAESVLTVSIWASPPTEQIPLELSAVRNDHDDRP